MNDGICLVEVICRRNGFGPHTTVSNNNALKQASARCTRLRRSLPLIDSSGQRESFGEETAWN